MSSNPWPWGERGERGEGGEEGGGREGGGGEGGDGGGGWCIWGESPPPPMVKVDSYLTVSLHTHTADVCLYVLCVCIYECVCDCVGISSS